VSDHPTFSTVGSIVFAACRAPSIHNSQPWRWRYDGERLELHADWGRQIRHGDPDGRDLEISCGAALHHAAVASSAEGWTTRVTRMPDPQDPAHLATVSFGRTEITEMSRVLMTAIFERRTDRRTPSPEPVPGDQLQLLVTVGRLQGALVTEVRSLEHQQLIQDLRQLSVILQHDDEQYLEEFGHWVHSHGRDGIPDGSVPWPEQPTSRFNLETRFPSGTLPDDVPSESPAPTWAVVSTSSDDNLSRLRAGEALSAMLLRATLLDLAVVPYTQAVEVEATRRRLAERVLLGKSSPQLLLRIGTRPAQRRPVPMTRRRAIKDVLEEDPLPAA